MQELSAHDVTDLNGDSDGHKLSIRQWDQARGGCIWSSGGFPGVSSAAHTTDFHRS